MLILCPLSRNLDLNVVFQEDNLNPELRQKDLVIHLALCPYLGNTLPHIPGLHLLNFSFLLWRLGAQSEGIQWFTIVMIAHLIYMERKSFSYYLLLSSAFRSEMETV